ncbi:MAG: hypothetical protein IPL39_14065 [Opitutaceae bacterium]|nr:hypothetical protein [Opitutaceae bacterium]
MAWRIDEAVIRGEIDNRTRGRVTGRLWLVGRDEPVLLELAGDCRRDLAGRFLEFTNPHPKAADVSRLAPVQHGSAGELTASRKVRVPDIPVDQIGQYLDAAQPVTSHWGNALYLDWFSDANGRVVIETAEYELRVVGDPVWEMTAGEEEIHRLLNACNIRDFMAQQEAAKSDTDLDDDPDDLLPLSELEAEQLQARNDLLADRIQARLTREGPNADHGRILEEEILRLQRELGEPDPTPEQLARNAEWIEEMNNAAEELLTDPEALDEENQAHPLAESAFDLSVALSQEVEDEHWVPKGASEEHPVVELETSVMKAATKISGVLNSETWPPPLDSCASIIVRLKRARVYLDDALRAMESCQEEKLIPLQRLGVYLVEIIDLAHDADEIIEELRERLEPDAE